MSNTPLTESVLIVDDDPNNAEALRYVLEGEGFTVETAANGADAIEHFRRGRRPCVVILDLLMPVMDGRAFLAMRKTNPVLASTPVVIVTASDVKLRSRDVTVFRKPVNFSALVDLIRRACAVAPEGKSA